MSAEKVFSKLSELYKNEYKRLPLDAFLTVKENTPSSLTLTSEKGTVTAFERFLSLRSTARSTPKRQKQISKTGGTPFFIDNFELDCGENLMLPLPALTPCAERRSQKQSELLRP